MSALYPQDENFQRRVQEIISERKQEIFSKRQQESQLFSPRKTSDEIKISVLTEENEKLRKQYADLVQKANRLVAAYRELEVENKELKAKNNKRDSVVKTVENSKNFFRNIWNNFINWLNT
jgi:hypothetical protein